METFLSLQNQIEAVAIIFVKFEAHTNILFSFIGNSIISFLQYLYKYTRYRM